MRAEAFVQFHPSTDRPDVVTGKAFAFHRILFRHQNRGVVEGQVLGTISDPLSDQVMTIKTPLRGRIIGMALDQVVMPGFAAFHIAYAPHPLAADFPAHKSIPEVASEEDTGGLDLEERPE